MNSDYTKQLKQDLINKNKESFYTAKETCSLLRISRASLSRLQKSKSIRFYKAAGKNGSVKFTADFIVAYLEAHTVASYGE